MKNRKVVSGILSFIGIAAGLLSLFPLVWMAVSGLKSSAEVLSVPFHFLPETYHFENYVNLLRSGWDMQMQGGARLFPAGASFVRSIFFTFAVAAFSVALSLLFNSMAAFAFARLEFPFKKLLWVYYLIPWFVPVISLYISAFIVSYRLGILDTFLVLTFPGIANAYCVFFYRQFYLNVPSSLEESALLDGASRFQSYIYIFIPLSKAPFVVMGVTVFLGYWSSFLWPILTISNPELYMVNQLVSYFKSAYNIQSHMILAASTLAALPTIVLFLIFQKYIVQGIKITGIK